MTARAADAVRRVPTLDSMSNADDAASRLSSALDEVFSRGEPKLPPTNEPTATDPNVNDEPALDDIGEVESLALPEIVPATADWAPTEQIPVIQPALPVEQVAPVARLAPPVTPIPYEPTPSVVAPPPAPTRPATGWGDHMATTQSAPQTSNLRSPGRRPRVRRVTRVLRHIDPWSTFKVAVVFSAVGYVVMLTSGVLLWRVAASTGTLDNIERWFTQFGWETFELKGDEMFHNAWIIGLFAAVGVTGGLVLLATLFNLVSDIVGGVRVTVLEEEVVERTVSSTRRYVVRRPPIGGDPAGAAAATDWNVDGDDESTSTRPAAQSSTTSPVSDPGVGSVADWSVDDD